MSSARGALHASHAFLMRAPEDHCCLQVHLNRFDLFHAHLFCTRDSRQLGLLFHAKEYPAYNMQMFPITLGYCQHNSKLMYDETSMDYRNMLWFQVSLVRCALTAWLHSQCKTSLMQGRLCCLDVGPNSILHHDLIMDGLQDVRTVLESDFGTSVIDVNYFASLPFHPQQRLFLC